MSEGSRYKKRIYVSAVALGLTIGSVGVAAAATGSGGEPAASTDETAEAQEVQEPVYTGSIQAPAVDESMSEADEAAQLGGMATITPDEAATSATGAVPGSAGKAELDNENGAVVYSVEVTDDAGTVTDVKVDAGDGAVLDQQVADGDEAAEAGDESGEAAEADIDEVDDQSGDQNEDQSDNDADEGAEDATEG